MEMLDKLVYKFFGSLDNLAVKIDSICYAGHEKIRSFFNRKTKRRKTKNLNLLGTFQYTTFTQEKIHISFILLLKDLKKMVIIKIFKMVM